ncbi:hypothetical protein CQ018_12715 [Arthrobacter sp. MYb227]|uniref:RES domain-containing protein n=1 Tax=Arthrobacter sp. MYb227 TaxID=1848601 RepID=UPI000CFCB985|nr:RES domain-containing protein [Arthrobacter sp. MYb227]PQZ92354.1 hypothetical protein CQ018_12715 [Arthrobacter sp. MYb227]
MVLLQQWGPLQPGGAAADAEHRVPEEVAVWEFLGVAFVGDPALPASMIAERWISQLEIPGTKAADFTAGAASAFGIVPGDITAPMDDHYVMTRVWAAAMDAAGFEGIQSRSRLGAGTNPTCLYVFGPAGEHELGGTNARVTMRAVIETMPVYTIDSIPTSDVLVVDP